MPAVMNTISIVGTFAMLWVGGHILLDGFDKLGWTWPYSLVHSLEHWVEALASGGFAALLLWCTQTLCSMIFGMLLGSILVGILHLTGRKSH